MAARIAAASKETMRESGFAVSSLFLWLRPGNLSSYSFSAAAKSAAGFAARVTYWRHSTRRACFFMCCSGTPIFRAVVLTPWLLSDMVVRAGQPSGWPVSNKAGTATPSGPSPMRFAALVVAITAIIGDCPYGYDPRFITSSIYIVFAAVRRAERKPRISMLRIVPAMSIMHVFHWSMNMCFALRSPACPGGDLMNHAAISYDDLSA